MNKITTGLEAVALSGQLGGKGKTANEVWHPNIFQNDLFRDG